MHAVVWRYRVRSGCEHAFAALYGSDGDWARLFRASPDYLGTTLYRDVDCEGAYLTIDRWRTRVVYEAFVQAHRDDYAALDARGDALTMEEKRLGALDD